MDPKAYLVTGTSSGIGGAIGRLLASDGHRIIGTHNSNDDAADEAVREGWLAESIKVDLSSVEARGRLITRVAAIGPLAGVVNNAAEIDFTPWEQFSIDEWKRVFEVNVHAPVHIAHALRHQIEDGGAIVNIASTDGMTGTFASPAYAASKAALINATKSLGNVLGGRGVRVNAIAPGWVDTGMSTDASYAAGDQTPLGRNARPDEIAKAARFLLGPDASFFNGSTMIVDGGYTNVDVIMLQELRDLEAEDSTERAPD